jgi:hypothetical protein
LDKQWRLDFLREEIFWKYHMESLRILYPAVLVWMGSNEMIVKQNLPGPEDLVVEDW